jgi:hypothetical protein
MGRVEVSILPEQTSSPVEAKPHLQPKPKAKGNETDGRTSEQGQKGRCTERKQKVRKLTSSLRYRTVEQRYSHWHRAR